MVKREVDGFMRDARQAESVAHADSPNAGNQSEQGYSEKAAAHTSKSDFTAEASHETTGDELSVTTNTARVMASNNVRMEAAGPEDEAMETLVIHVPPGFLSN